MAQITRMPNPRTPRPRGMILYCGPSMLDGSPIVAIVTGLTGRASRNTKTGAMLQTWILRDDVSPTDAIRSGDDVSVCGDCRHRPANGGSCYVQVGRAPLVVWRAFKRGIYPEASGADDIRAAGAGRVVRVGSYGDPAAVPADVWRALIAESESHTGYTHQWAARPDLASMLMASADSALEALQARAMGYRTFRVRLAGEAVEPREFVCPASNEAGARTTCSACRACGGTRSKARAHPVIIAHGPTARRFAMTHNGQPMGV